jgi:succinyl-CoA synthetase beta subunit
VQKDLSLIEINPLVLTEDSKLIALDAKINVDDRGLYRHPDIEKMRDISQEDPLEYKASVIGVSYVSLDGNIGCLVNGAGLAMSTMDIVKYHGSMPANFLDVGGGASKEQIVEAFKLLFANPNVKSVLINIFGGILRCDILAQGIVDAAKEVKVEVPIVVRLEGTLVEEGRKILASSGLKIIPAENMTDGAVKSIKEAGQK